MALTIIKSTSLQGQSVIDGQVAIYLSANVSGETAGNSTITQSIQNQELYAANRAACRKDISDFQDSVYEVEDQLLAEAEGAA